MNKQLFLDETEARNGKSHQLNSYFLPRKHNSKPISRDAIDDQFHFPAQWPVTFCSCHFSLGLPWKETDQTLRMEIVLQLSMTVKLMILSDKYSVILAQKDWHTCPADRQRLHASSNLPALNRVQTSSRRDSSCFYRYK